MAACATSRSDSIGADRFIDLEAPAMGGEDFARYLDVVPGCFLLLGNGDTGPGAVMLHNNHYEYDDSISPTGAALWVALAENFLPFTKSGRGRPLCRTVVRRSSARRAASPSPVRNADGRAAAQEKVTIYRGEYRRSARSGRHVRMR